MLEYKVLEKLIHVCRYALTLRIMLANLRRKVGLTMPPLPGANGPEAMMAPPHFIDPSIVPPPQFTMEELGLEGGMLPGGGGPFSPSAIPLWLQEQVSLVCTSCAGACLCPKGRGLLLQSLTDLGLPVNGSDGIFLQMGHGNGWMGDFPPMPEAW